MDRQERAILSATGYGHFLSHFNMLVFPALALPLSKNFGLDLAATLDLGFWMYLLFGITALPWGILADKFGSKPLLALFYLGGGCSGLAAALFVKTTAQPFAFQLALAGVGLFSGIYHPAGLGWIAKGIPRTAAAMAINGIFGSLGLAMGPLLAGLINWLFGVQAVYFCLGILNFTGILFLLLSQKGTASCTKQNTSKAARQKKEKFSAWKGFLVLLICMMLGGTVYRGATVSLPALFELNLPAVVDAVNRLFAGNNISANVIATVTIGILYLFGMYGQYIGGKFGERFDLRYGYLGFHLITIPFAFLIGWASNMPLILLAALHSFFLLGMQPLENTLVARLTPAWMRSSAYGMKFILTFGVGALSVKLIKYIEQGWGISRVFPTLGIISIFLVLMIGILILSTQQTRS
ncbi:MAG: MFS transporter [Candidatus Electrothrix aestuarii]|uniref:MFS transporter n=1 Tax=Candidatus Electrothrix aestuarii TaxID=3062594 RepID=A0AAU8LU81_9BACT|nr:MFS transporter [Candidatus Electrothrix aestuarii]